MRRSEHVWRGLLALLIVGTIPLSMWGSGCSSQPLVQPDASGQSGGSTAGAGGLAGGGGASSGGSGGGGGRQSTWDGSVDGLSACCTGSDLPECASDGHHLRECMYRQFFGDAGPQCPHESPTSAYSYVWDVYDCPSTCAVTVNTGPTGTGGAGSPVNFIVTCN